MNDLDKLTKIAMELQAISQIRLTYTKDLYDQGTLQEFGKYLQN